MANVTMTPQAAEDMSDLPLAIHARVLSLLERLRGWPSVSGAKPLKGKLVGHYRLRTGDYRLQFHLRGETVVVDKIGHRDKFYE